MHVCIFGWTAPGRSSNFYGVEERTNQENRGKRKDNGSFRVHTYPVSKKESWMGQYRESESDSYSRETEERMAEGVGGSPLSP